MKSKNTQLNKTLICWVTFYFFASPEEQFARFLDIDAAIKNWDNATFSADGQEAVVLAQNIDESNLECHDNRGLI